MKYLDFGISGFTDYLDLVDKKIKEQTTEHVEGINRLLQASGKRLRPRFVIAMAHYSGRKIDDIVINAAAAVELVHLASLIHDDIIDSATLRWNVPTISSKEGINSAILAGDYLIAKGCFLAAKVSAKASSVMAETVVSLCNGQAAELRDRLNLERSRESLLSSVKDKTSSLFSASCYLGGLTAKLDPAQLQILSDFAENFGVAFQYADDVNDFLSSAEVTDKSNLNDLREGNYTLAVILSLQGPNKNILKKLLKQKNPNTLKILEVLKTDNSLNLSLNEADRYRRKALLSLHNLENKKLAGALTAFLNQNRFLS